MTSTKDASGGNRRGWIVLFGMRGAGKSTVGRELARLLKLPFVDLDQRIEDDAGCSISVLFAREGEDAFRARETKILERLSAGPCVLATGGGVIERARARALLSQAKVRIWLQVAAPILCERLAASRQRPRLRTGSWAVEIRSLLRSRGPHYRALATHVVRCGRRDAMKIAQSLARQLEGSRDHR